MQNDTLKLAIQIINGRATTTSLRVAESFGKRHADVLRAIERLECSADFHERNFAFMSKPVKIGNGAVRKDTVCTMTRDGFVFLAMGFTGKEAAQWKEAYINAFNAMEAEIARQHQAQQEAAALPVITQADLDMLKRIDKRAWQLAQAAFEDFRNRMMEDVLVKSGHTKPEDWEPVETSKEMIEMILASVSGLESMTRSLRRRAARLEATANYGKVSPEHGSSGLRKKLNKQHK